MTFRILGVDLSGIFAMNWMATQGMELSQAFQRTIDAVARHREGFDRVAIAVDSGTSFRRGLWPSYKMNRQDRGPAYYEQLRRTADRLGKDACTVMWAPRYAGGSTEPDAVDYKAEADDVLATLCTWAQEGGHTVRILTNDKDLFQLVKDGAVDVVKPDGKVLNEAAVCEIFQIPPQKIPLLLGLAGDKSDNFKPYEGLGDKRAVELIRAFAAEEFQGVDAIWQHVDDLGPVVTDAVAKRLLQAGPEPGRKALQVATLIRDLQIDFSPLLEEPVRQPIAEEPALLPRDPARFVGAEPSPPPPAAATKEIARSSKRPAQTALVKQDSAPMTLDPHALQPRCLRDLDELATCLYNSRMYNLGSKEAIMAAAVEANERGKPIGMALRNSYDVRGRLAWSASWLAGLVLSHPVCEYAEVIEADDTHCVIEYKKRGRPERTYAFTIEDARKAGWVKSYIKDNRETCKWITNPKSMCTWACWRQMARERFPEVVSGMYTPDEYRDGELTDAEFIHMEAA